ncbi:MAG: hypothetical protein ACMUHB_07555 [Thermoplasmatota archaeon]
MIEDKKIKHIAHELHEIAEELEEDIDMLVTEDILKELADLEVQYQKKKITA